MTQPPMDPLAALMYQIAQAEPQPWYPKVFAEARGVPRDSLDSPLERLRLLGLVELTEWVANNGQGYRLTSAGKQVLYNPGKLVQLQSGTLPPAPPESEAVPARTWDNRDATPLERGEVIRAGLMSRSRPLITYVLLFLNIGVFLVGLALVYPDQKALGSALMGESVRVPILTGALTPTSLVTGEWWRLLTSCFVHFGIIHLGVNMYSLWILGPLSEKAWGRWRFLALYLISGLGGSCAMAASMINGWEPAHAGAGASGALWGLMAGFGVWVFLNRASLGPNLSSTWLRQIGICVLINLFLTFSIPYLSKSGHIGGGVFGAVAAVVLNEQRFSGGVKRWLATVGAAALPVLAITFVVLQPKPFFHFLNETAGATDEAEDSYLKEVVPVLKNKWNERDEADVARAKKVLKELDNKLAPLAAALERAGHADGDHDKARQALLDYIRAQKLLFEMAGRKLEKGEAWTANDQEAFQEQQQTLNEIGRRYVAIIKGDD